MERKARVMETVKTNFIWDAVQEDLRSGRYQSVHTRFPPEPNGYLHIGHCKALVADFLTAEPSHSAQMHTL